jgi:hypothetical protein
VFSPTNYNINIVVATLLKHQQWRNGKVQWIGEDTNHGQLYIVGAALLKHQQWRIIDISLNCGERGLTIMRAVHQSR